MPRNRIELCERHGETMANQDAARQPRGRSLTTWLPDGDKEACYSAETALGAGSDADFGVGSSL